MYKIGDKVLYKDNTTVRRIRDINEKGELLLWGMYEYTDPKNVKSGICINCEQEGNSGDKFLECECCGEMFCEDCNDEIFEDELLVSGYKIACPNCVEAEIEIKGMAF